VWGLTSCVQESLIDDSGLELNPGLGDQLALQFSVPISAGSVTRANPDDPRVGEILINGIRIVLYGAGEDNAIYERWDYDVHLDYNDGYTTSGDDLNWLQFSADGRKASIWLKAKKVKEQADYRMLVIINPNDEIKARTEISEDNAWDKFKDTTFDPTEEGSLYGEVKDGNPTYFLMLNADGDLVNVSSQNFWGTPGRAESSPVGSKGEVAVERVAAKIVCTHIGKSSTRSTVEAGDGRFVMHMGYDLSSDYDIPDWVTECPYCGGAYEPGTNICEECGIKYGFGLGLNTDLPKYVIATDLMWQVDIVNKKSYWYRHHESGDNTYAIDPNYVGYTDDREDNYLYSTDTDYGKWQYGKFLKLNPAPPEMYKYGNLWTWQKGDDDTVYVPENTMPDTESKKDVTRVIVKATLRKEWFKGENEDENIEEWFEGKNKDNIVGDFFLFKGGEQGDESKYNMNNKNGDDYFYLLPVEDVVKYKDAPEESIPHNLRGEVIDGVDLTLKKAIEDFAENTNFNWNDLSANKVPLGSDRLIFYKKGEIFYEVQIKHGELEPKRYGIVRNSAYQLNLKDILNLGSPTIPPAVE